MKILIYVLCGPNSALTGVGPGMVFPKQDDRPSVGAFSFLPSFPHLSVSSFVKWVCWTRGSPRSFQFCCSVQYERKKKHTHFKGLQNSITSTWTNTALPRVHTAASAASHFRSSSVSTSFSSSACQESARSLEMGVERRKNWGDLRLRARTSGWVEGPQWAWTWPWRCHVVVGTVAFGAAVPHSLQGMWPQQD